MFRRTYLDHIQTLDPVRDHMEIVTLTTMHEFPFDHTRSLEFALFRTYGAPRVSDVTDKSGEFGARAQKRYDDTDLLLSEIFEQGYDSERGRAALRRMNQQHGRFPIPNEDLLYVLSTFVFEPPRWINRFSWRPMVENEKLALFHFWREVGKRMNIKDIPSDYETFERFSLDYERTNFRFADSNQRLANATRDLFIGWFLPRSLWKLGEPVIYAMLDDLLLEAFGYPRQSAGMQWLVQGLLKFRGRLVRWLPERRKPRLRTGPRRPTYPQGYRIEELGPRIKTEDG